MNRAALLLSVAFLLVAGALFADASPRGGRRRRELLHNVVFDMEHYADIDVDPNNAVDASSRRVVASKEGGRASGGSKKGSKSRGKSCRRGKASKSTKKSGEAKSKCEDSTTCVNNWNDFKDEFELALSRTEYTVAFCPGAEVVVPETENFEIDVDDNSTALTSLQLFCCGDDCRLDGNSTGRTESFIELNGSGEKVFELVVVGMAIENFELENGDGSFISIPGGANVYLELSHNNIASIKADNGGFLFTEQQTPHTVTILSRCNTYKNNTASGDGGVFLLNIATFHSEDDLFENNEAGYEGGAMFLAEAVIGSFENVRFINNIADFSGALYAEDSDLRLENCLFESNRATDEGGAMWADYNSASFENVRFVNNVAKQGGALYAEHSDLRLENCLFEANQATEEGGAMRASDLVTRAHQVDFIDNECREGDGDLCKGGAIYHDGQSFHCKECAFDSNSGDGAAVYGEDGSHQLYYDSSFKNNNGTTAVYNTEANLAFLKKVEFKDNSAPNAGEENVVSNYAAINYVCDGVKETDIPTDAAAFRKGEDFLCKSFRRMLAF